MSLFDRAVASALPVVPRSVVRRVSVPYRELRGGGLDNVGIVLQAYLNGR